MDESPSAFEEFQTDLTNTTITYTYDSLYRLTGADYSSGDYFHYTYDPVGNRLTQETLAGTNTYTYDAANRLADVDGVAYSWDAGGNLLSDGSRTFTYDHANRLIALSDQGSAHTYAYNGLGDRLGQSVDGGPTTYTLDLNTGLTQVLADGSNTYLYGIGRIGEVRPGGWNYHLSDALGSVRQVSDPTGLIGASQIYEPFGKLLSSQGSSSSSYGLTGEWTDSTNLIHLRARYLEPEWGRFFTRDPWRGGAYTPSSLHPYLYARNNPVIYRDPSGRCYGVFDFLRGMEPRNCQNLDMARTIFQSPETSAWDKARAFAYGAFWSIGHVAIGGLAVIGAIEAPGFAVGGALFGGGYSAAKQVVAASGKCGCEAQQLAKSQGLFGAAGRGVIQGFLGGGLFGLGGVYKTTGRVVAGATGFGLSGYGAVSSGLRLIKPGGNLCDVMDFVASGAGMYLTGRYTANQIGKSLGNYSNLCTLPDVEVPRVRGYWENGNVEKSRYWYEYNRPSLPFNDPALRYQVEYLVEYWDRYLKAPSEIYQGGSYFDGELIRGLYRGQGLPDRPLGYYTEMDLWPSQGPGTRLSGRIVFGRGGEVFFTSPHYEYGFVRIR